MDLVCVRKTCRFTKADNRPQRKKNTESRSFPLAGIEGLWYGTALGYVVMVGWLFLYCRGIDWQEQARLAVARSSSSTGAGASGTTTLASAGEGDDGEEAEDSNEAAPLIGR